MGAWSSFAFVKVRKVPKLHLNDFNGWGMADCMCNMVLETIKHAIQRFSFFSLVVMRSQISITKARFQSMVMWLKTRGGCPYS